jgi:hypothetical protein
MHDDIVTVGEGHEVATDACRINERMVLRAVKWDSGFRMSDHGAALGTEVKSRLLFVLITLEFHISNHEMIAKWPSVREVTFSDQCLPDLAFCPFGNP